MANDMFDDKDNDKDNFYNDRKKNLNFKDSWLQNSVELAALGAIMAGAGKVALDGNFSEVLKGAKQGVRALGKGWENYVKRNGSMGAKFGMQVGKKTFFNLLKMQPPVNDAHNAMYQIGGPELQGIIANVENDPEIKKKITKEVSRRLAQERGDNYVNHVMFGTTNNTKMDARAREIYQQVKDEEIKNQLGLTSPSQPQQKKTRFFGVNPNDNAPIFDPKKMSRDMIGSGLTGLAFAGGISGFHAIDRLSSNKDNQKKLEDSFQHAGSFLTKGDDNMNKQAGSLEIYNRLMEAKKKFPEAVFAGLGYTGVSLGAAKMLGQDPRRMSLTNNKNNQSEDGHKGPRVIIELGSNPEKNQNNLGLPPDLDSLPKLSSDEISGLAKLAAFPKMPGLGQFVQDLMGHTPEIERIQKLNPADIAAEQLKGQDIPNLLKEQYGNLVSDKTEANMTNRLFDSQTEKVKREHEDQIRALETRTADARLKAGAGGALLAGGGLAALAARKRGDERHV